MKQLLEFIQASKESFAAYFPSLSSPVESTYRSWGGGGGGHGPTVIQPLWVSTAQLRYPVLQPLTVAQQLDTHHLRQKYTTVTFQTLRHHCPTRMMSSLSNKTNDLSLSNENNDVIIIQQGWWCHHCPTRMMMSSLWCQTQECQHKRC